MTEERNSLQIFGQAVFLNNTLTELWDFKFCNDIESFCVCVCEIGLETGPGTNSVGLSLK